jgi:hypothetical protein
MRRGPKHFVRSDSVRAPMRTAQRLRELALATAVLGLGALATQSPVNAGDPPASDATAGATAAAKKPTEQLVPLDPKGTVQLDRAGKRLLVRTHVVLREGFLEMLACPAQTKEHESILGVEGRAYVIHAGLLALGAKAGAPVQYQPTFRPPTGQPIDIFLQWADADGKRHRVKAQEWIRYATHRYFVATMDQLPAGLKLPVNDEALPIRFFEKFKQLAWFGPMTAQQRDKLLTLSKDPAYRKAIGSFFDQSQSRQLDVGWVFPGSGEYVDPTTGHKVYEAEAGDLICVSNFPDAMLDLAIKSTDKQDEGLLFEAWTERIPPRGTEVTIELVPRFEKPEQK